MDFFHWISSFLIIARLGDYGRGRALTATQEKQLQELGAYDNVAAEALPLPCKQIS
jgi:hypothetical protein